MTCYCKPFYSKTIKVQKLNFNTHTQPILQPRLGELNLLVHFFKQFRGQPLLDRRQPPVPLLLGANRLERMNPHPRAGHVLVVHFQRLNGGLRQVSMYLYIVLGRMNTTLVCSIAHDYNPLLHEPRTLFSFVCRSAVPYFRAATLPSKRIFSIGFGIYL